MKLDEYFNIHLSDGEVRIYNKKGRYIVVESDNPVSKFVMRSMRDTLIELLGAEDA